MDLWTRLKLWHTTMVIARTTGSFSLQQKGIYLFSWTINIIFTQFCDLEQVANIKIANENTFYTHEVLSQNAKIHWNLVLYLRLSFFFFFFFFKQHLLVMRRPQGNSIVKGNICSWSGASQGFLFGGGGGRVSKKNFKSTSKCVLFKFTCQSR